MIPSNPRDDSPTPTRQVGDDPRVDALTENANRQPEMSDSNNPPRNQGAEPDHWLVPDTRDDIVVSRMSDFC